MSLVRKLIGPQLIILALIAAMAAVQISVASAESTRLRTTAERLQRTGLRIQRLAQLFTDTERDLLSEAVIPGPSSRTRIAT